MKTFLICVLYLAVIGIIAFLIGRLMPKTWFPLNAFPYSAFPCEKDGSIYLALGVRKWKDFFPDMSAILPGMIPSKRLPKARTASQIEVMIRETCVAECVHGLLCLIGFGCVFLWKGIGGWAISILYALGNLPYIIIQRYNRPKFMRLWKRLRAKESGYTGKEQERIHEKGRYTQLQYGARS